MNAPRAAFADAFRGLRLRRRRTLLTAIGIALSAAMLSAALVVADGLGRGFDRAARAADLPDIIVRFDSQPASRVAARVGALPDVAGFAVRREVTGVGVAVDGRRRSDAVAEVVSGGRRGYAIVAGRDVSGRHFGEVVVERGFADAWGIPLGEYLYVGGLGAQRVVGLSEAPDNVSFPLSKPRVYLSRPALAAHFGAGGDPTINLAQIWLRDPGYLNEVLVQARSLSYGLRGVRFVTRSGVHVLLDQAAGIVIDLLVALSVIALVTAGVMLAAAARAEVQRRLGAIGVRRAVGATRGFVALSVGFEALVVAVPAATLGAAAGVLATYGPGHRLLTMLNEPPPGFALALPLAGGWLVSVVVPSLGAAWPAWRAAGRSPVALLRGGEFGGSGSGLRPGRGLSLRLGGGGLGSLGARLVRARRARLVATVVTLGLSTAFVLLMLSLASALTALETDPGALGKRYQLTATLPPSGAKQVRAIAGVAAAAPRYEVSAADSFSLGETVTVIGYPGDHTVFEAPPLVDGRRIRGSSEAEVGAGLADALGLSPGSTLALALGSGSELRLRVAGVVSSLNHDGRVAYVPAAALLGADPGAPSQLAIRLVSAGALSSVSASLSASGALPSVASGATARGAPLVDALRAILVAVAVVDGLVCLYALLQACALTVQERRRTVAVLRASGAGPAAVRRLLAGAAIAIIVPAAVVGVVLERLVLGPAIASLAASYATLSLGAGGLEIGIALAGLALAAAVAVSWVARQAGRESVVAGLAVS